MINININQQLKQLLQDKIKKIAHIILEWFTQIGLHPLLV